MDLLLCIYHLITLNVLSLKNAFTREKLKNMVLFYTAHINVIFLLLVSKVVLALTNNNNNIEVKTILITKREEAKAMPVTVTNYALFVEGRYVTHEIQSEKILSSVGIK